MRTVNQATQDAWSEISYTKKRIYIPGLSSSIDDEYIGSMTMKEAISDTENLFFVGCISTKVDITLNDYTEDIDGQDIEIYVQKGNTEELKVFTGKIYKAEVDGSNNTMKVVCYDAMYRIFNADVTTWYDELELPMSMASFRASFFERFNIAQKSATLIRDSFLVERTIGGESGSDAILGRDIIKPLCEANAVLGHINYDGEMEYLFPTANEREVELDEVSSMTKEDYTTALIDKVIVREDEQDIGAVSGTGTNAYIVEGNMFFLGLSAAELQTIADNFLDALDSVSYQPIESVQMYNPIYELGDLITVPDGFGNEYTTIILERETDFDRETVKAKGLEEYSMAASYSNDSLIKLRGKANRLYRDIEETRSTITDVARGLQTEIRQTAEGIEVQIQDLQRQIDGEIEDYEREGTPTLLNYPYWDFTSAFVCDGTKKCDAIYNDNMTEGGNQYPHFYYSETDRRNHQRDLVFDNLNAVSYRFNYVDGQWIWQEIADSETSVILSRLSTLEATAETLQSEYTEISLDLSGNYYTKVQTDSKISQSASAITLAVSQTYATKNDTTNASNPNSLKAQLNVQAGLISAKASQTGGSASTFAYELTPTKFVLKANNKTVLSCDSNGLNVEGNIASSSTISGARLVGCTLDGNTTMANLASFNSLAVSGASQLQSVTASSVRLTGSIDVAGSITGRDIKIGYRTFQAQSFDTTRVKVVTQVDRQYSSALGGYYVSAVYTENIDVVKAPTLNRYYMGAY